MNNFGERLKDTLKQAGYTQAKATEELGLSRNAITNYVGGRIPDATILYKLSNLLGVSMEWLLTGIEDASGTIESRDDSDGYSALTNIEKDMVKKFKVLKQEDKEELLTMLDMKYDRYLKKEMSSTSKNGGGAGTNETA